GWGGDGRRAGGRRGGQGVGQGPELAGRTGGPAKGDAEEDGGGATECSHEHGHGRPPCVSRRRWLDAPSSSEALRTVSMPAPGCTALRHKVSADRKSNWRLFAQGAWPLHRSAHERNILGTRPIVSVDGRAASRDSRLARFKHPNLRRPVDYSRRYAALASADSC